MDATSLFPFRKDFRHTFIEAIPWLCQSRDLITLRRMKKLKGDRQGKVMSGRGSIPTDRTAFEDFIGYLLPCVVDS